MMSKEQPMTFAYADPPYLGCCKIYEHTHHGIKGPWDGLCWDHLNTHQILIEWLQDEFPDGWALSLNTPSLRQLLPMCPDDARVASWVKTFCAFKKGVRPCYAWEPIIFRGGRNKHHPPPIKGGQQTTPKDFHAAPITLKKGLTGAKPESVCRWVLDLLNVQPDDDVIDVFPGTGVMGRVAAEITTTRTETA